MKDDERSNQVVARGKKVIINASLRDRTVDLSVTMTKGWTLCNFNSRMRGKPILGHLPTELTKRADGARAKKHILLSSYDEIQTMA